jgi:hypothetical protein
MRGEPGADSDDGMKTTEIYEDGKEDISYLEKVVKTLEVLESAGETIRSIQFELFNGVIFVLEGRYLNIYNEIRYYKETYGTEFEDMIDRAKIQVLEDTN